MKSGRGGIKFEDIRVGDGPVAERGCHVEVRYDWLLNRGDPVQRGQTSSFRLGGRTVIAGLEYGIEGMRQGGLRRIRVGPHLAYGPEGVPGLVPKDAILEFLVDLLRVVPGPPQRQSRLSATDVGPQMCRHLFYFRPGEEARMLARCQFGVGVDGRCGATLTYPIRGYPWRRNPMRSYPFDVQEATKALLFAEVNRIRVAFPTECLSDDQLWSDSSEKANAITRDRQTNTLCHTVGIYTAAGDADVYYSIRESSEALLTSELYRVISALIQPYEKL